MVNWNHNVLCWTPEWFSWEDGILIYRVYSLWNNFFFLLGVMRCSIKVRLRLPEPWNPSLPCGVIIHQEGAEENAREQNLVFLSLQWRAKTGPQLFLHAGWKSLDLQLLVREGTISANWKDTGAGMIFCQEGHLGVLAEGRGLPQSVCTFSGAFDSGPNSLSCANAGAMDGKCLLARLARSSNRGCWDSARSFPLAGKFSFLSWSEGVCQNSNSQGSPEAAYD